MDTLYKILDLLWKSGLSEAEFCQKAEINRSAVTDWKKGKTKSYMKHIPQIAKVLGVTEEYLLNEKLDAPQPTQEQQDEFTEMLLDCSPEEKEQVKQYIKFIKSQRMNSE